jgi:CheY-like chemotaxis protein
MDMSNRGKIMVVDDELDILFIVRRYLEKWGYEVDTFSDPLHALQIFKANSDRFMLVLTDIRMPEMTGIQLAHLMLKTKPDTKIVIMTAYDITTDEFGLKLPTITHQDILQKPFKLAQVCGAIKKQLDPKPVRK